MKKKQSQRETLLSKQAKSGELSAAEWMKTAEAKPLIERLGSSLGRKINAISIVGKGDMTAERILLEMVRLTGLNLVEVNSLTVAEFDSYLEAAARMIEADKPEGSSESIAVLGQNDVAILSEMLARNVDENNPQTRPTILGWLNWKTQSKRAMESLKAFGYVESAGKRGFFLTKSGKDRARKLTR